MGESLELWNHINDVCADIILNNEKDTIKWALTKKMVYTLLNPATGN